MSNFIYITTNKENGKQYIGSHNGKENDTYLGSGKILLKSLKKYGKESFKRELIEKCDPSLNLILEEKYIKEYNTLVPNGYNISPTGGHGLNGKMSKETKNKISNKHKGKKLSKNHKEKISLKNKGRIHSKEEIQKRALSNTGNKRTEKTKEKISNALKSKNLSIETKKKLSESHRGLKHSKETKKKISENNCKFWKNKKRSKETKEKISNFSKGKTWEEIYGIKKASEMREKRKRKNNGK